MLEDDPYLPLFQALSVPLVHSADAFSDNLGKYHPHEMNLTSVGYDIVNYLPYETPLAEGTVRDWRAETWFSGGLLEDDCSKKLRLLDKTPRLELAVGLAQSSKEAPIHFATRILLDWDALKDQRDSFREDYARYPDVQWALAKAYKYAGEYEESIEAYNRYISMVQDGKGYIGLSEAQYQSGEDEIWLETLEKVMECEDYELTHATAAQHAASTLMYLGRFEDAREWATRSAASYSGWGVNCLIECLTGLGELDQAELLAAQMTERYDQSVWYDWCAEVGAGDLDAAWEAKQEIYRKSYADDHTEFAYLRAYHALVIDDEKSARDILATQFEKKFNAWYGLMLAVLEDRAGNVEARDAALKRLAERPADAGDRTPLCEVAIVIQHAIEKGALDRDEYEESRISSAKTYKEDWSAAYGFFVGFYLATHGEPDQAVELWKIPARVPERTWARTLAWVWLRRADVDPIHLDDRMFPSMFYRVNQ